MVECEYRTFGVILRIFRVLIDTWWNVNDDALSISDAMKHVLIDTWWNVNAKIKKQAKRNLWF